MKIPKLSLEEVVSLKAADLENLTSDQEAVFSELREWISEYNMGRGPKPNLDPGLRLMVSEFAEMKMDEQVFGKDYDFLVLEEPAVSEESAALPAARSKTESKAMTEGFMQQLLHTMNNHPEDLARREAAGSREPSE